MSDIVDGTQALQWDRGRHSPKILLTQPLEDAGIGTQNIDPTVPIDGRLRHRLHVGKLRDISPNAPTVAPPLLNSCAAASASFRWRATMSTFAPWPANTLAMPLPIPLLPPVTMTDLPLRDADMAFSVRNDPSFHCILSLSASP